MRSARPCWSTASPLKFRTPAGCPRALVLHHLQHRQPRSLGRLDTLGDRPVPAVHTSLSELAGRTPQTSASQSCATRLPRAVCQRLGRLQAVQEGLLPRAQQRAILCADRLRYAAS